MEKKITEKLERLFDEALLRMKRKEYPKDFPILPEVPAGRYTSSEFYDRERQHVWSKVWLYGGHVDEILEIGNYKLWLDGSSAIVLIRGKDDVIRGFYNTCSHRGGPLVREECGSEVSLRCKYHCWNYDLEGNLIFIPDEHEYPGVIKTDKGLASVRVELWGNFIFVNENMAAEPLSEYLGAAKSLMSDYKLEKMRMISKDSTDVNCNWKVFYDAFIEVYHLKFIHAKTANTVLNPDSMSAIMLENGHSMLAMANRDGVSPTLTREGLSEDQGSLNSRPPAAPGLELVQKAVVNHNIFPNLDFIGSENLFPMLVIWPLDVNHSRVDMWWFGYDGNCDPNSQQAKNARESMNVLLEEDVENLEWVQRSMESNNFKSIPLGHHERLIYLHEEEVDRLIGEDNIPSGLAVTRILDDFIER
jgi:phenylpropionate dioxygenase-like ring-hydroxylating dioxygenase large terminal subunit